ncbi:hypothetical protein JTB14_027881 [Gonioctena quinquepunctata]|nr:hypothetical protein JTB14_027881 [Gonioctena quinquepunctata]
MKRWEMNYLTAEYSWNCPKVMEIMAKVNQNTLATSSVDEADEAATMRLEDRENGVDYHERNPLSYAKIGTMLSHEYKEDQAHEKQEICYMSIRASEGIAEQTALKNIRCQIEST